MLCLVILHFFRNFLVDCYKTKYQVIVAHIIRLGCRRLQCDPSLTMVLTVY
jgi:hypothetical protein